MQEFLPYAWFEGKCIPFKDAKVSIATHALHYGTAAFGGMRAIPNPSNKDEFLLFRTDKHIKRLSQSARLLLTEISEEYIFNALKTILKKNTAVTAWHQYIRLGRFLVQWAQNSQENMNLVSVCWEKFIRWLF